MTNCNVVPWSRFTAACSVALAALMFIVAALPPASVEAQEDGFDFGSGGGTTGGSGSFSQFVPHNERATLGTIPSGIKNLVIDLTAENDLDIELWDGQTFAVGWVANGVTALIHSTSQISSSYNGVSITWSGWDGTGGKPGNEFIRIEGVTQNAFLMKVFGYQAGRVQVDYSWEGTGTGTGTSTGPAKNGSGSFSAAVPQGGRTTFGTIPSGIKNLRVDLAADRDLDVELWNGDVLVVGWQAEGVKGRISSPSQVSGMNNSVAITWSGWDGTANNRGSEFIRINGTTQNPFVMKVFGYEQGSVMVNYSWGDDAIDVIFDVASLVENVAEIVKLISARHYLVPIDIVGTIEHTYRTGKLEIAVPEWVVQPAFQLMQLLDSLFGGNFETQFRQQSPVEL